MKILVLVERLAIDSYRARSGEPLVLTADGASRDEALRKLRQLVNDKLCSGAELTEFTLPVIEARSWPPPPIYDPDDPMVDEMIEIMKENRRKADEDPDYL
jgi:hypothetical protein